MYEEFLASEAASYLHKPEAYKGASEVNFSPRRTELRYMLGLTQQVEFNQKIPTARG
jgi:hypothetical protein